MKDGRKQAVSLRLGAADIRRIKRLARRLGVRDSDVIRYALKVQLARLAPLCEPAVRGRDLMLALAEPAGIEVLQHFELDEESLERIINDAVEPGAGVEREDLQTLAVLAAQRSFLKPGLPEVARPATPAAPAEAPGSDPAAAFRRHLHARYASPAPAPGPGHNRRATDKKPAP